jgi:hypothetical protein
VAQAGRAPWVWYGWSISIGEQEQWFVYATFGRDERDNILNATPHCEFTGNAISNSDAAKDGSRLPATGAKRLSR